MGILLSVVGRAGCPRNRKREAGGATAPGSASDGARLRQSLAPPAPLARAVTAPVAPGSCARCGLPLLPSVVPTGFTPFELPEVVAGETFLSSLTRSLWGRVAVLAVSGLLRFGGGAGGLDGRVQSPHAPRIQSPTRMPKPRPPPADASVKPTLPSRSSIAVGCPSKPVVDRPPLVALGETVAGLGTRWRFLGPWWQPSSQALLIGLHLGQEQVRRLTWASTDLADCAASVRGRPRIGRRHRRRPAVAGGREASIWGRTSWPAGRRRSLGRIRLLAVDAHTIVTGSEEALRQLVARGGDAELASGPMELLLKKLLAGRRPGRDGRSFAADCGGTTAVEVAGQVAGCLAGRQVEVALALRDSAGLGTFGPIGRPAAMRAGAGLQRRDDGRKDPLGRREAGARCDPGLARAHRRAEEHSPAEQVFGRDERSIQAAPGRLARGLAHRPLRYGGRHRLAAFWLGRAGALGLGSHGHRELGRDTGRLVGRCPDRG